MIYYLTFSLLLYYWSLNITALGTYENVKIPQFPPFWRTQNCHIRGIFSDEVHWEIVYVWILSKIIFDETTPLLILQVNKEPT